MVAEASGAIKALRWRLMKSILLETNTTAPNSKTKKGHESSLLENRRDLHLAFLLVLALSFSTGKSKDALKWLSLNKQCEAWGCESAGQRLWCYQAGKANVHNNQKWPSPQLNYQHLHIYLKSGNPPTYNASSSLSLQHNKKYRSRTMVRR